MKSRLVVFGFRVSAVFVNAGYSGSSTSVPRRQRVRQRHHHMAGKPTPRRNNRHADESWSDIEPGVSSAHLMLCFRCQKVSRSPDKSESTLLFKKVWPRRT